MPILQFWLQENRRLNSRSRALCRVAAGVPLGKRKAPRERVKIHLFRGGLGGIALGRLERTRRRIEPELPSLFLSLSLSLSLSPSFSFYLTLLALLWRDFMQSAAFTVR